MALTFTYLRKPYTACVIFFGKKTHRNSLSVHTYSNKKKKKNKTKTGKNIVVINEVDTIHCLTGLVF